MLNIRDLKCFKENAYTRNLVVKSPNVEILVVCWKPGQGTVVHDHGKSDGVMMILTGEMTEVSFYPDGSSDSKIIGPGDISHVPVGIKHKVENTSQYDVVSFHVYAPGLERAVMGVDLGYDNATEVQEVQLPDDVVSYIMAQTAPKLQEIQKNMHCEPESYDI